MILIAVALSAITVDVSGQPSAGKISTRAEKLTTDKGQKNNKEFRVLMDERKQLIDALLRKVREIKPADVRSTSMGASRAIYALGELRSERAIPVLVDRIHIHFHISEQRSVQGGPRYPALFPPIEADSQKALVRIGYPALEPVLAHYISTRKNPLAHANVIVSVFKRNKELSKAWLVSWKPAIAEYGKAEQVKAGKELIESIDKRIKQWNATQDKQQR